MSGGRQWCAWGFLALLSSCAQSEDPDSNLGSETHWLSVCESTADCGSHGLTCECGLCSLPCAEDGQCSGYQASCAGVGESATTALCGLASIRSLGICLPSCEPGCAADQRCLDGACIPLAVETPPATASNADAGEQQPSPTPREPEVSPSVSPVPTEPDQARADAGSPTELARDASVLVPVDASRDATPDAGLQSDASLRFDAGASDAGTFDGAIDADAAFSGVDLRAVVTEVSPGNPGIAAEWVNGTLEPIYLPGCSTVSGWSYDGMEWQEHGAFFVCAMEGPMVAIAPGQTYLDTAGDPPNRGIDVWRLVGTYAVGCVPDDGLFSEAVCSYRTELTSDQVNLAP
jgi:hypothetical protein